MRENRTPGSVRGRPGQPGVLPRYIPVLGRWLGRDPIGEKGGVNYYLLVSNDPLGSVDHLGLSKFQWVLNPNLMRSVGWVGISADFPTGILVYQITWNYRVRICGEDDWHEGRIGPTWFLDFIGERHETGQGGKWGFEDRRVRRYINPINFHQDRGDTDEQYGPKILFPFPGNENSDLSPGRFNSCGLIAIEILWNHYISTANLGVFRSDPRWTTSGTGDAAYKNHGFTWHEYDKPHLPAGQERRFPGRPDDNGRLFITMYWNFCEGRSHYRVRSPQIESEEGPNRRGRPST